MQHHKWTIENANNWYEQQSWLVGVNFIPSTAINQLEMWQAASFDPQVIDRELGWAAGLGFNAARVYLHDLLWLQDSGGFKDRIRCYLDIADQHGIKSMFVFFDDCWHDDPALGQQPTPRPGIHNSGWVKSPGTKVVKNRSEWGQLEDYVRDIVSTFGSDERVVIWDVYNEPGNTFLVSLNQPPLIRYAKILTQLVRHLTLPSQITPLLQIAFEWARAEQPDQPLTSGLWYMRENLESRLNPTALALTDVVTFHSYFDIDITSRLVDKLRHTGRPIICTEYLARGVGSKFQTHLPYFKERCIGCFNWGLVSSKTQTIYSWEDYYPSGEEPPLWFHDIFRQDGSPYLEQEVALIKEITSR
jgi:hypothetical protein